MLDLKENIIMTNLSQSKQINIIKNICSFYFLSRNHQLPIINKYYSYNS